MFRHNNRKGSALWFTSVSRNPIHEQGQSTSGVLPAELKLASLARASAVVTGTNIYWRTS